MLTPIWMWWTASAVAGAVLLPIALNYTFLERLRRPLVVYAAVQILCAVVAAFAGIVAGFGGGDVGRVAAVIPTCGLLLSQSGAINDNNIAAILTGTTAITLASIALLLLLLGKPWREFRRMETAASALIAPPVPDASEPRSAH